MYRIPEKQFRKPNGLELRYTLFLSVCKSPTQSHTFHRTEISWHFFTTFRFDSFHFILFCASWALSWEFTLLKGKNIEETLCLPPRQFVSTSLHLRLYANYYSSAGFPWRQKYRFWIPKCLPFGAPLFILAIKILKAKLQTFHSNVLLCGKARRNAPTDLSHATRFKTA